MHIQYVFNVVDLTSVLVLFWSSPNWCQHRWPGVLRIPDFQTGYVICVMFQIPIIYPINPIYWITIFLGFPGKYHVCWLNPMKPSFLLESHELAVCQNLVPLVNIKKAGKWMFIPLKMVLIGIDPYPTSHLFPSHHVVPGGLHRARRTAAAGRAGAAWSLGGGAAAGHGGFWWWLNGDLMVT